MAKPASSSLPVITVITPSFNQAGFIQQTIDSVLDQEYPKLEYLVVDGGSTDGTIGIIKRYARRLQWISERDRGQSDAINKGLRLATGDVLTFLNSDDCYLPGALWKVGTFFARHPEAYWVTGKCRTTDTHGREIRRAITLYKNFWLHFRNRAVLFVLNYISQPATFWRKEVTREIGYFTEELNYTMDYDYWLRISQCHRLWFIDSYLAGFRVHPSSKSGSTTWKQFNEQFNVANSYAPAAFLLGLQVLHNALTTATYQIILKKDGNYSSWWFRSRESGKKGVGGHTPA